MNKEKILWADDEIDLLKPHILFLENKGYEVHTVNSGTDAIDECKKISFDLVILDENMPGLSGLDTLSEIKAMQPSLPIIMITKSEEEDIMNQAIGGKIADYLIKPVNPNQILLSIKKNLHINDIISEKNTSGYRQAYNSIAQDISFAETYEDWIAIYQKITHWELELVNADKSHMELLKMQKNEANSIFSKFIKKNYHDWIKGVDSPLMSHTLFKTKVFPALDNGEKIFIILIDNLRFDQWRAIKPILDQWYNCQEEIYCSILPTATQYARNAIFSGLLPNDILKNYPELWVDDTEEEGKNLHEEELIKTQIDRYRRKDSFSYAKINENAFGEKYVSNLRNIEHNNINIAVVNFIDMLSHARTDSKMIRELASSESAYRALTRTWLEHSSTLELFKQLSDSNYKVIITTDHGTIKVDNAIKVIGDRETNTNLRYKVGKTLDYNPKQVYEIKQPAYYGLPSLNLSSTYIFATNRDFFAYPNNYNHYVGYYRDTFQHGGISMEEMLIPWVTLTPKK